MDEAKILLSNILSLGDWATWKNSIDQVEECLKSWRSKTNRINFRRVYLVGCGSSYYAGQVGKWIIEHIAHLPAEAKQAFSFTHYTDSSLFTRDTLVIGLSTTGNTVATNEALSLARQNGATTLAITAVPDSKITRSADDTIFTGGRISVIVQTETYVQSLIALYLVALNLVEKENRLNKVQEYWHNQIRTAREITHEFLDTQQAKIIELVEEYQSADNFFILGNGPNAGTAEEAALKVIEMAKMFSDGSEMEDFFHGRDRELVKGSAIFFLAPQSHVLERMFDFLTFNRMADVPSIVITCQNIPELKRLAYHEIFLRGALDEFATPLVYITPLYLFSYHLALKRGFDPISRRYPVPALKVQYRGSEYDQSMKEVRDEI
jgi:glucosamine--fructose-6-phosphate aminotransferase (isomerizing)